MSFKFYSTGEVKKFTSHLDNIRGSDPVLSNISIGFDVQEFAINKILKPIKVDKEKTKLPVYGKESQVPVDDLMGLTTSPDRIISETSWDSFETELHKIATIIADREREEVNSALQIEKPRIEMLTEVLLLNQEKKGSELLQTLGTYPTGNKLAMAGGTGTKYWNTSDGDPIKNVQDAKRVIQRKTGKKPNVLLLGTQSLDACLQNENIRKAMFGSYGQGILTIEHLKQVFKVDDIILAESIYKADLDTAPADLWYDVAILAYQSKGEGNQFKPNFGFLVEREQRYTLKSRDEMAEYDIYAVGYNYGFKITWDEAGYLLYNTCNSGSI